MKNTTYIAPSLLGASPSHLRSRAWAFLLTAAILPLLLSTASSSFAMSATWKARPATGDWNTAGNWTAGGPPNGPADTATFASSNITGVSISAGTEVNGIVFNAGASPFMITASPLLTLTLSGVGITNNSGITQNFVTDNANFQGGTIKFTNSATAGSLTAFTVNSHGLIDFFGTSTAGSGTFTNNLSVVGDFAGQTFFNDTSTAGNSTFTNNGEGGATKFFQSSTAGNGTFTTNGGVNAGGLMQFFDTSTAGNGIFTINDGANRGAVEFLGTSTAGSGTFTSNGGAVSGAFGGFVEFLDASTAGNGIFTINGGAVSGAFGGLTEFTGIVTSTAGNGIFTINGGAVSGAVGGEMQFGVSNGDNSTAGNATLIANGGLGGGGGGLIQFTKATTGGTARVEVFGNGNLDISGHDAPGVTTGSIEGSGAVFLGANNLTVGSNNLTKTFSGIIQDGGLSGGTGGSLTKIGNGKLTLSKASTYTGGTTITKGTLLVTNTTDSGTGTGAVQVNKGTLGGTGKITGAVTVGTGTSSGAILLAGKSATNPGTLTINSTLTFKSLSTYQCVLNRSIVKASKATGFGVTINSGATFSFVDTGTGTLTVGTVFTVINNTSAIPIFGTFSNLADGSVFTSNGNNYQVSYEGGTGNDLTLTVVP